MKRCFTFPIAAVLEPHIKYFSFISKKLVGAWVLPLCRWFMDWFGFIFWQINHCTLFNAKFFLYIYNRYQISEHILLITFLNKPKLIFFTQLNGFTYLYLIQIILQTINHLFVYSLMFSRISLPSQLGL